MRKKYNFLNNKHRHEINIFDLDDTLVVTPAKIIVKDQKKGEIYKLTPSEFNSYEQEDHHELDFSEFHSLEILKAGKLIDWVLDILKSTMKKGKAVGIITARSDWDVIVEFLIHHGILINRDFVFAVSDNRHGFTGSIAERKKQALLEFVEMGFTNFQFFDDNLENLRLAKEISREIPEVKMKTTHIKKEWIPHLEHLMEFEYWKYKNQIINK